VGRPCRIRMTTTGLHSSQLTWLFCGSLFIFYFKW
jgi:hypothetical protein